MAQTNCVQMREMIISSSNLNAVVVQLVECFLPKEEIAGSSPVYRSIYFYEEWVRKRSPRLKANVAQLVEQCFRKAEVKGSNPFIGSR